MLASGATLYVVSSFIGFVITRVPFVRTDLKDIQRIVAQVHISQNDVFFDLGSGDGKVCFEVNKLSGAKALGFELTWWTYWVSQIKKHAARTKYRAVGFTNQNFFKHSWQEATVIYGYLYPPLMGRVEEKFLADCKPGTYAVVRDFPLPNLKPFYIINPPTKLLQPVADTKRRRFKILLKSLWPKGNRVSHEIYIYCHP